MAPLHLLLPPSPPQLSARSAELGRRLGAVWNPRALGGAADRIRWLAGSLLGGCEDELRGAQRCCEVDVCPAGAQGGGSLG